jgi:hypothetical protein
MNFNIEKRKKAMHLGSPIIHHEISSDGIVIGASQTMSNYQ